MGSRIITGAQGREVRVGDLRMEERSAFFPHETGRENGPRPRHEACVSGLEGPFQILWFFQATFRVWLSLAGGWPLTSVGVCGMSTRAGVGGGSGYEDGPGSKVGKGTGESAGVNALEAWVGGQGTVEAGGSWE